MAKVREKSPPQSARRSTRKRASVGHGSLGRLDIIKKIFFTDRTKGKKQKDDVMNTKAKSVPRYKQMQCNSSDESDSENVPLAEIPVPLTPQNRNIQPKRLNMNMTPNPSKKITQPRKTPQSPRTPHSLQPSQPAQVSQISQTTQLPVNAKTIAVKKKTASDATWVNNDVCTISYEAKSHTSNIYIFRGDSTQTFWQSPIPFTFVILQGKFKCDQHTDQLTFGDEINVPAGKKITITHVGNGGKDGRLLCFAQ